MEIVYQRGTASVADVIEAMDEPPSYSAVRTIMNLMVDKGFLNTKRRQKIRLFPGRGARQGQPFGAKERPRNLLQRFGRAGRRLAHQRQQGQDERRGTDRLAKLIDEAKVAKEAAK